MSDTQLPSPSSTAASGASVPERFHTLVTRPDDDIDLAEVALAIACVQYPELDLPHWRGELAAITQRVEERMVGTEGVHEQVSAFSLALFEEEAFRGNVDDYYDARNSYLNDVLSRRLGIPITLAVVYLDIGWRLGLPVSGVAFPGHFLVKWEVDEGVVVVDPFSAGATLDLADLENLAKRAGVQTDPRELLDSCRRKDIAIRMLRNLCGVYANDGRQDLQLEVLSLILSIEPEAVAELVVRAELLDSLDCHGAALVDFETLQSIGLKDLPDGRTVREEIRRLKLTRPVTH